MTLYSPMTQDQLDCIRRAIDEVRFEPPLLIRPVNEADIPNLQARIAEYRIGVAALHHRLSDIQLMIGRIYESNRPRAERPAPVIRNADDLLSAIS